MNNSRFDAVDGIQAQWAQQRPDLDAGPIGVIGRVSRLSRVLDRELKAYFAAHGLEAWEFDVLATLRRTGAPHELPMGGLLSHTMVTSGAVTNRIDRLEARGLVCRSPSAEDRRSVRVRLTDAGLKLVNDTVAGHLDNERRLLAVLDAAERDQLGSLLRKLLLALDDRWGTPAG